MKTSFDLAQQCCRVLVVNWRSLEDTRRHEALNDDVQKGTFRFA